MVRTVRQLPSPSATSIARSEPSCGCSWRERRASFASVSTIHESTRPSLRATSRMLRVAASASYRSMVARSRRLLAKKNFAEPAGPAPT
jgi:hypothetical protein